MIHILSKLGDDYNTITVALKVRENPISYPELFDKLTDYERTNCRTIKKTSPTLESIPTTANYLMFYMSYDYIEILFQLATYVILTMFRWNSFHLTFFVKDLCTGARLMRGERTEGVYHTRPSPRLQVHATFKHTRLSLHHKLGHPSTKVFKSIVSKLGLGSKIAPNVHCPSCSINKSHKLPFGPNSFSATHPIQLIYSDVWGPVQKSIDGFTYYVIFVDYFTKYVWIYPMKRKSDVVQLFPLFKLLVEKYFPQPIVSLFSDNGGEYLGLLPILQARGISHYTTPPHTP